MEFQAEIVDEDLWEDVGEAGVADAAESMPIARVNVDPPAGVNSATHEEGCAGKQLLLRSLKHKNI